MFGFVLCPAVQGAVAQVVDVEAVQATWERIAGNRDTLGYALYVQRVDSTRTDQVMLFFNTAGEPDAWRAVIDGRHYIKAPAYGVYAITDSVLIARDVLRKEPDVLDALNLIEQIEKRVRTPEDAGPPDTQ